MLDIKFIRENKDAVAAGAKKKHIDFDVEELLQLDDQRKEILASVEEKRARQNAVNDEIVSADETKKEELLDEMKKLKSGLQEEENQLKKIIKEWRTLMIKVPNIPDMTVPDGEDDSGNLEIRVWGDKPNFDFKSLDHIDLMLKHDMVDFERGVKISGFRGYVLKNDGVRLQWALMNYVLDKMSEKGFTPLIVPSLVNKATLLGTGYLPQGEEDLYKTQDEMFLSGTAEVSAMSYYADEFLEKKDLPKKFIAFSPCYRREAGAHGKDTKGLIRLHEFYKLEQIILCEASHEQSVKFHEELTANAEEIMQSLGLPHRVVINCGGDLGLGQVKKYDIESWVPSQDRYLETHSSSYFHDFQSRRLNIKYKDDKDSKFIHSLNNTAIAVPRILVQIVENHQQSDGSIKIPEVLIPYFKKEFIGKD